MAELANCPNCNGVFVKNNFRDVCEACYKKEAAQFDQVYQFIRKRENRTATIPEVVIGTGVEESIILKFIKTGKLRIASNPNLGYPCEKCETIIREGRLCPSCNQKLRSDITKMKSNEQLRLEMEKREKNATYHTNLHGYSK